MCTISLFAQDAITISKNRLSLSQNVVKYWEKEFQEVSVLLCMNKLNVVSNFGGHCQPHFGI
jgi:hypothetical protein